MKASWLPRCGAMVFALLVCAAPALAHFVWIESEAKNGGLLVRSGFGEPGGWDTDLVGKVAQTKYWIRSANGLQPLAMPLDKQEQEYRAQVDGTKPAAILGACDYGVIQLGSKPAILLRYTAKHLIGKPTEWDDNHPASDLRVELFAELQAGGIQLKAVHLGKPLAGATIKATPPQGEMVQLTTDTQGVAKWPLSGAGLYACYVGGTVDKTGELDGKPYTAMKDYATLTFTLSESESDTPATAAGTTAKP